MATDAAMEALTERLRLAEVEIIALKNMEAPNLATLQALVGIIDTKVKTIDSDTFGGFVKTELLKVQDEMKGKGKGKSNNFFFKKEIMESKAIQEITKLSDGTGYRKWLNKMKNRLEQARRKEDDYVP